MWLGPPKPEEPLRILYACTQRPGYGGASTESYEAIKLLRARGHEVTGFFVDGGDCNPDKLPDIRSCAWEQRTNLSFYAGSWHVIVGKMYEMGRLVSRLPGNVPSVFITSGCRPDRLNDGVVRAFREKRIVNMDVEAFEAASKVICHSTLDWKTYERSFPPDVMAKFVPEIIRTSAMAAARLKDVGPPKPLSERHWDICMTASEWGRDEKNGGAMVLITREFSSRNRIVVCGRPRFGIPTTVSTLGIVSHEKMLEVMRDSRVVIIPSIYDSSPNVYIEAAMSGCNIVVTPFVGNIEDHPPDLVAAEPQSADPRLTYVALKPCVERALALDRQLHYNYETPDGAVDRLVYWLRKIAAKEPI